MNNLNIHQLEELINNPTISEEIRNILRKQVLELTRQYNNKIDEFSEYFKDLIEDSEIKEDNIEIIFQSDISYSELITFCDDPILMVFEHSYGVYAEIFEYADIKDKISEISKFLLDN